MVPTRAFTPKTAMIVHTEIASTLGCGSFSISPPRITFCRDCHETNCFLLVDSAQLTIFSYGQSVVEEVPPVAKTDKKVDSKASESTDTGENPYLRILYDQRDDPRAMQTSVVSFARPNDSKEVTVDLIGAVHVADKAYFQRLNRLFRDYDALLYELVAPKGNIPQAGNSRHPVGQMQKTMKQWLDLAYQLEEIDYTRKNFVHADMSPEEFSRVMSERGESFLQMMMRAVGAAMAKQSASGRGSDFELLFAFGASDRSLRLKRILSTQFNDLEFSMKAIEGEKGSTIIGQRNKKALDVLEEEMAAGKKRIAIFYGAGHMPDMEKRMFKRFGMSPKKESVKWLTAWDMSGEN